MIFTSKKEVKISKYYNFYFGRILLRVIISNFYTRILFMDITIASFDVGYTNFAQYVEKCSSKTLLDLQERYSQLPETKKRRVKGPMTSEIEKLLEDTALSGTRIQTGVYDFTERVSQGLDNDVRLKLLAHLTKFEYLWDICNVFVIEQQFYHAGFGKGKSKGPALGANVDAIKLAEAVFMWFLDRYPFKTITYFGSQFKTQIFGAPWKMTKIQRKTWATKKAEEIYNSRKDYDMITVYNLAEAVKRKQIKTEERVNVFKLDFPCDSEDSIELSDKIIRNKQKLDDTSDACVQAQAFKYRMFVGCF